MGPLDTKPKYSTYTHCLRFILFTQYIFTKLEITEYTKQFYNVSFICIAEPFSIFTRQIPPLFMDITMGEGRLSEKESFGLWAMTGKYSHLKDTRYSSDLIRSGFFWHFCNRMFEGQGLHIKSAIPKMQNKREGLLCWQQSHQDAEYTIPLKKWWDTLNHIHCWTKYFRLSCLFSMSHWCSVWTPKNNGKPVYSLVKCWVVFTQILVWCSSIQLSFNHPETLYIVMSTSQNYRENTTNPPWAVQTNFVAVALFCLV